VGNQLYRRRTIHRDPITQRIQRGDHWTTPKQLLLLARPTATLLAQPSSIRLPPSTSLPPSAKLSYIQVLLFLHYLHENIQLPRNHYYLFASSGF